jgi:hypothetical protein
VAPDVGGSNPLTHPISPIPVTRVTVHSDPHCQDCCRSLARLTRVGREGNDSVTKPFSLALKQPMVARLTGKDAGTRRRAILVAVDALRKAAKSGRAVT